MPTTYEQRLRAIDRANEVRLARAELKRRIERGDVFAASVILHPPEYANRMPVGELLVAQRHWGAKRMGRLLGRLEIPENVELAGPPIGLDGHRALTDRQRRVLARALGWSEEEGVMACSGFDSWDEGFAGAHPGFPGDVSEGERHRAAGGVSGC